MSNTVNTENTIIPADKAEDNRKFIQQASQDLMNERQRRVIEYAQHAFSPENKGKFKIRLRIPAGKGKNAFGEEEVTYKEGEYETKTYSYHKIASSDWNLYKSKSAEMVNELNKGDLADQVKVQDLNNRLYEFIAIKCLKMTHDEFVRAEWDDIRLAVDACNHMTEWSATDLDKIVESEGMKQKPPRTQQQQQPPQQPRKIVNKPESINPNFIEMSEPAELPEDETKEESQDNSSSNMDYGKDYDG